MKGRLFLIMLLTITMSLLFIPFNLIYAQEETASIRVEDQAIGENNMVTVAEVVSPTQGWVVIHLDQDGSPGSVAGYAMVDSGTNSNVMVEVDPATVTDMLYAMLHSDTGVMGEYEFPDADPPVTDEEGNAVMQSFTVTIETSGEVEEQAMEEEAEALPATGFNFLDYYLFAGILLIMGAMAALYLKKLRTE